MLKSNIY